MITIKVYNAIIQLGTPIMEVVEINLLCTHKLISFNFLSIHLFPLYDLIICRAKCIPVCHKETLLLTRKENEHKKWHVYTTYGNFFTAQLSRSDNQLDFKKHNFPVTCLILLKFQLIWFNNFIIFFKSNLNTGLVFCNANWYHKKDCNFHECTTVWTTNYECS